MHAQPHMRSLRSVCQARFSFVLISPLWCITARFSILSSSICSPNSAPLSSSKPKTPQYRAYISNPSPRTPLTPNMCLTAPSHNSPTDSLPTCRHCRHRDRAFTRSLTNLKTRHDHQCHRVQLRINNLRSHLSTARRSAVGQRLPAQLPHNFSPSGVTTSIGGSTITSTAPPVPPTRLIGNTSQQMPSIYNTPGRRPPCNSSSTTCQGCLFRNDRYVATLWQRNYNHDIYMSQQLRVVQQLEQELQRLGWQIPMWSGTHSRVKYAPSNLPSQMPSFEEMAKRYQVFIWWHSFFIRFSPSAKLLFRCGSF